MSKEFKRNGKSMVDLAVAISIAPENCKDDNWGDMINLCGECDLLLAQYESKLASVVKLVEALEKYGKHTKDCNLESAFSVAKGCNCELGRILAEHKEI